MANGLNKLITQGFVAKDLQEKIINLVDSATFPYYWNENAINIDNQSQQYGGFNHTVIKNGQLNSSIYIDNFRELLIEIFKLVNINNVGLHRLQVNFLPRIITTNDEMNNAIHIDEQNENFYTLLYYVNDADGNTQFFDDDKNLIDEVQPEQGKFIIFKSNQLHAAGIPIKYKKRIVINTVFYLQ